MKQCLEEWEVPHPTLTDKEITGWSQLEDDAEWQCVAIAYLKHDIKLEELEFLRRHFYFRPYFQEKYAPQKNEKKSLRLMT